MEAATHTSEILRLKASLHPFTVLELNSLDIVAIKDNLAKRLQQAPQLLKFAPVVIQLPNIDVPLADAQALLTCLRELHFIPVGLRGGPDKKTLADDLQLSLINEASAKKSKKAPMQAAPKFINGAVRSGQQVVNTQGDIVILGNVGQGAEVLAAGSIHIHGTLYGRALAGIQGNQQATISCHKQEAELISIAGEYQISEDLDEIHWQKTCYVQMQDGRLILQSV